MKIEYKHLVTCKKKIFYINYTVFIFITNSRRYMHRTGSLRSDVPVGSYVNMTK